MHKGRVLIICLILLASPMLISWGVTGHRTIGRIAENHLSANAKAAVLALLGNETLADASTWADEVRSQPEYQQTAPWHFLNLPLGLSYPDFEKQVEGMSGDNVYSALQKCEHALGDPGTSRAQQIEALKFIIHFVGDMHQPMHISRAEDKGGNTIQLNYEGNGTNLHSLWDTRLLEHQGLSDVQLAEKYDQATPQQIKQWQSDPPLRWIWESYEISSRLYAEIDAMNSRSIGDAYYEAHIPIVADRIEKAGIRLAGVLNAIFKNGGGSAPSASALSGSASSGSAQLQNKDTTICDKVYGVKVFESSQMVLLNVGGEYPNQKLTIVIKGKNRDKFPLSPEVAFKDKSICVTGVVISYKGKPEIEVTEPSQITVGQE